MRFERLGRRLKIAAAFVAPRRRVAGAVARCAGRLQRVSRWHELTDEQREIRELARRFADEVDRAAARRSGTASTRSRARCSSSSASSG